MNMAPQKAASADARRRYCLLNDKERAAYRCAETAETLEAVTVDERLQAYWHHFKTHIEAYSQWAQRKHLFDPTFHFKDVREKVTDLVEQVLIAFQPVIHEGRYSSKKGVPCKYIKRSIRNRFQDILRKGRHPTKEECLRCWRERGGCRFSGMARPGGNERQRCLRPPAIEGLDVSEAAFALAGLQDEWLPRFSETDGGSYPSRPVEREALDHILDGTVWDLIDEELTADQKFVLREVILNHKTGREIAQELKTSRSNVYQLKRRGINRLTHLLLEAKKEP